MRREKIFIKLHTEEEQKKWNEIVAEMQRLKEFHLMKARQFTPEDEIRSHGMGIRLEA